MTFKPRCAAAVLVAMSLAACATTAPPVFVPIPGDIHNVPIGKEQALRLALAEFRRQSGNDPWYTREHVSALLVRSGERRVWSVMSSASPIAGGGGRATVDADTGEVLDCWLPVGIR
jgi:hypothetical protein